MALRFRSERTQEWLYQGIGWLGGRAADLVYRDEGDHRYLRQYAEGNAR